MSVADEVKVPISLFVHCIILTLLLGLYAGQYQYQPLFVLPKLNIMSLENKNCERKIGSAMNYFPTNSSFPDKYFGKFVQVATNTNFL